MGILLDRWLAAPVMTMAASAFLMFFCVLVPFVVLELHPRFRRKGRGPIQPGHMRTTFVIALVLFPLVWTLVPTGWGNPVDGAVVVVDGETRMAIVSYRDSKKGDDWCAVRAFTLEGRELDHSLWTSSSGCRPMPGSTGRVRWYGADAGVFVYETGVAIVDLWTGAQPFLVDDAIAAAALPGDGEVRVRGVEADHLVLELQDGSRRYLSTSGQLVAAPDSSPAVVIVSLDPLGDEVERLGSVFKVRPLACGGLVVYRALAFGDDDDRIGCVTNDGELVVTECGPQLGIEPPVAGTLRTGDTCWVVADSVVGLDAQGRVTRTIPL